MSTKIIASKTPAETGPGGTVDTSFGILATAVYLPRLRLDRATVAASHRWMAPGLKRYARGTRTMINWDEDALTMAVEAGRAVLANLIGGGLQLGHLALASTTLPFADRLNAGVVRSALALPTRIGASDAGGSMRAGTTELLRALQAGGEHDTLVIGAEHRLAKPASSAEMLYGDGAAAVVVGHGEPVALLLGAASESHDFIDHFRESDSATDYQWEERWIRDEGLGRIVPPVAKAAMEAAQVTATEIDYFLMPALQLGANTAMAKKLGIRSEAVADSLFDAMGDAGAAHPLVMLAAVLERALPGQKILLVQFGNGCDALVLQCTAHQQPAVKPGAWLTSGRTEKNYFKFLSFNGQIDLEWGMRAEMDNKTALSAAWRSEAMIQGFMAGDCSACGTVQFPSSRVCVNPACAKTDTQTPHRLADEPARIRSYTSDWLSYRQCPPFQFGHVEFASGARVLMEFTDTEPDELAVDAPLDMVFRIKESDGLRGFRRYFWKARAVPQLAAPVTAPVDKSES